MRAPRDPPALPESVQAFLDLHGYVAVAEGREYPNKVGDKWFWVIYTHSDAIAQGRWRMTVQHEDHPAKLFRALSYAGMLNIPPQMMLEESYGDA